MPCLPVLPGLPGQTVVPIICQEQDQELQNHLDCFQAGWQKCEDDPTEEQAASCWWGDGEGQDTVLYRETSLLWCKLNVFFVKHFLPWP